MNLSFWSALEPKQCANIRTGKKQSKGRRHQQQGRETTRTNKLSCGSIHSVHESLDVLVGFLMLQFILQFVVLVALYLVSPIQLLSMHQTCSLSDLYGNSLSRFTLRKWSCEVLSLHPRRLQQTAVSCKRSNCNKIKNLESRTSEVLSKDGKQRVPPFHHVALHVISFVDFLLIIMSSTRNRSIATSWRKNSTMDAISDTSRMALA